MKISHQFFNILALLILNIAFWLDLATKKKAVYQESLRAHPPRPSFWPKGSSMLTGVGQVCHGYMRGINMDIETTKYAPSFCIAQINSPKKIKFWKEKAFEDGITLGPTAQATLVCL